MVVAVEGLGAYGAEEGFDGDDEDEVVMDEPVPWWPNDDEPDMDEEPDDDADDEHVLDVDELDDGNFASLWSLVIILFLSREVL